MPVLDGPGAVEAIRALETKRQSEDLSPPAIEDSPDRSHILSAKRAKIFALSGLASKADKVRAFNAGVDG